MPTAFCTTAPLAIDFGPGLSLETMTNAEDLKELLLAKHPMLETGGMLANGAKKLKELCCNAQVHMHVRIGGCEIVTGLARCGKTGPSRSLRLHQKSRQCVSMHSVKLAAAFAAEAAKGTEVCPLLPDSNPTPRPCHSPHKQQPPTPLASESLAARVLRAGVRRF